VHSARPYMRSSLDLERCSEPDIHRRLRFSALVQPGQIPAFSQSCPDHHQQAVSSAARRNDSVVASSPSTVSLAALPGSCGRAGTCSPASATTGSRLICGIEVSLTRPIRSLASRSAPVGNKALKTPLNSKVRTRQIVPSPSTENSYGNDPDYRFGSALVRWRRILGSQSRPLVKNRILLAAENR
jgi:hypothetical protein